MLVLRILFLSNTNKTSRYQAPSHPHPPLRHVPPETKGWGGQPTPARATDQLEICYRSTREIVRTSFTVARSAGRSTPAVHGDSRRMIDGSLLPNRLECLSAMKCQTSLNTSLNITPTTRLTPNRTTNDRNSLHSIDDRRRNDSRRLDHSNGNRGRYRPNRVSRTERSDPRLANRSTSRRPCQRSRPRVLRNERSTDRPPRERKFRFPLSLPFREREPLRFDSNARPTSLVAIPLISIQRASDNGSPTEGKRRFRSSVATVAISLYRRGKGSLY